MLHGMLKHTCGKCVDCGKAQFEQLMECEACMQELHAAVEKAEAREYEQERRRARAGIPLPPELSGMWRELVARTTARRFASKRPADNAHE